MIDAAAARFLTTIELEVCTATMTDPAKFALAKRDRTTGKALMMATPRQQSTADPANAADAPTGLKAAMEDIKKFLADPDHLDGLQFLISAEAWVKQACQLSGAQARRAGGWE